MAMRIQRFKTIEVRELKAALPPGLTLSRANKWSVHVHAVDGDGDWLWELKKFVEPSLRVGDHCDLWRVRTPGNVINNYHQWIHVLEYWRILTDRWLAKNGPVTDPASINPEPVAGLFSSVNSGDTP